jgi:hypothetical protein
MRGSTKPDPTRIYVSWQTACLAELEPAGVLRRGDRYPGNHWLVKARPEFYVVDGERLEDRMREKLVESIGAARGDAA